LRAGLLSRTSTFSYFMSGTFPETACPNRGHFRHFPVSKGKIRTRPWGSFSPLTEMSTRSKIIMFVRSRARPVLRADKQLHLWANCLDNVRYLVSHKPIRFHCLLRGQIAKGKMLRCHTEKISSDFNASDFVSGGCPVRISSRSLTLQIFVNFLSLCTKLPGNNNYNYITTSCFPIHNSLIIPPVSLHVTDVINLWFANRIRLFCAVSAACGGGEWINLFLTNQYNYILCVATMTWTSAPLIHFCLLHLNFKNCHRGGLW
jgi:hypothetical protein